ncbi:MAG: carboxypeptidase-like regulatory domain-containing protein [Prolixibacteraceae bacterium]|nr:carboxypeptidase-like regulatory domain-containing protein [Prolixibacteraceae bacterium]
MRFGVHMKVSIIIVLLQLTVAVSHVFSQPVNLDVQKTPLTHALNELGRTTGLKFAFDNGITDNITVSGRFKQAKIDQVLASLLEQTSLDFRLHDDVVIVYPSSDKNRENKSTSEETLKTVCMVKGMVKDHISGESLPFATVYVPGSRIGTLANGDGLFTLITRTCDSTDISISYIGYKPVLYRVMPEENPQVFTVSLSLLSEEIKAIEFKYEEPAFQNSRYEDAACTQLNLSRVNDVASFSELDIFAPLQMLPGIDGTIESSAGLTIRKTPPDKNLIVYDGFNIYLTDHLFGSFSTLNSKLIKDIKVYKAITDVRQGGRTSSVVEITGKSGNMYKPSVDFGMDMLAADLKIELPIVKEKLSFIIAGRRSYTDYYQTPVYVNLFKNFRYDYAQYYKNVPFAFRNQPGDPAYLFYDVGSKLTWRPSEKQMVSLSYYRAVDDLNFGMDSSFIVVNEKAGYSSEGLGIRWTGELTRRWNAEVTVGASQSGSYYSNSHIEISEIDRPLFSIIDTTSKYFFMDGDLNDFSGSFTNRLYLNSYNSLEFGYQLNYYESKYESAVSLKFNNSTYGDTIRNYYNESALVTPYAQHLFTGKRWNMKSGIRMGYYSLTRKSYPEIRFSVSYKANEKFTVKNMVGNYFQFTNKINMVDNGVYRGAWVLSDSTDFPVVQGGQLVTGFNYKITRTLNLDVEFYHRQNKDLLSVQNSYTKIGNQLRQEFRIFNESNTINGVDVLITKNFGKYQAWIAYTLSSSVSQADNLNKGIPYPSTDDQLHELKLYNSLTLGPFNLTLSWIYGSGKPWDEYIFTENYRLADEYEKNSSRLPPYHRMDAGLNYTYKAGNLAIKAGLNVFNIYNHINITDRFYQLKDNPVREILSGNDPFKVTEVKGLGTIPNVYLNIKF